MLACAHSSVRKMVLRGDMSDFLPDVLHLQHRHTVRPAHFVHAPMPSRAEGSDEEAQLYKCGEADAGRARGGPS